MNIKNKQYPPNYEELKKHFGIENNTVVFTYGDDLYNPQGAEIPEHLLIHETVHAKEQKKMGVDEWWEKYIKDKQFRLEQELLAYGSQYAYAKERLNTKGREIFLEHIASVLASEIYGNIISPAEARSEIRNASKACILVKNMV